MYLIESISEYKSNSSDDIDVLLEDKYKPFNVLYWNMSPFIVTITEDKFPLKTVK